MNEEEADAPDDDIKLPWWFSLDNSVTRPGGRRSTMTRSRLGAS